MGHDLEKTLERQKSHGEAMYRAGLSHALGMAEAYQLHETEPIVALIAHLKRKLEEEDVNTTAN